MEKMKGRRIGTIGIAAILVFVLSGCSGALGNATAKRVSDEELFPAVAKVIDEQKEVIEEYIGEDIARSLEGINGEEVVNAAMDDENGRDYLEFCYTVHDSDSIDDVYEAARPLLNDEQMAELEANVEKTRTIMMENGEEVARALKPSMRAAFWKDLQALVIKASVLFAAGIVYACIPNAIWWGKIAAAAAVAVATGVVAATIMSLVRFYKFGGDKAESFEEWMTSVTTQPKASYALAAGIISVGSSMKRSPVLTGIIVCVFGLYSVIDEVKGLLTKYDFNY